jgi:hypothetical protein
MQKLALASSAMKSASPTGSKNVWKKGLAAGPFSVIEIVTLPTPTALLFLH